MIFPTLVSPMRVCAGSCACSPGSCTHIGTWTLQRKNWSSGLQPIIGDYCGHVTKWRVLIGHLQPYWIRGRKVSSPALASPCSWCPIMFGMPVLLYSVAHCNLNIYILFTVSWRYLLNLDGFALQLLLPEAGHRGHQHQGQQGQVDQRHGRGNHSGGVMVSIISQHLSCSVCN